MRLLPANKPLQKAENQRHWGMITAITAVMIISSVLYALKDFDVRQAAVANGLNYDTAGDWEDGKSAIELPCIFIAPRGETRAFSCKMKPEYSFLTMDFQVSNAAVRAYLDEQLIYEGGYDTAGNVIGERNNLIDLPDTADENVLTVVIKPVKEDLSVYIRSAVVSKRDVALLNQLKSSLIYVILCVIIILFIGVSFIVGGLRRYMTWDDQGIKRYAITGLSAILLSILSTGLPETFFENPGSFKALSLMITYSIPATYMLYVKNKEVYHKGNILLVVLVILLSAGFAVYSSLNDDISEIPSILVLILAASEAVRYIRTREKKHIYQSILAVILSAGCLKTDYDLLPIKIKPIFLCVFTGMEAAAHLWYFVKDYRDTVETAKNEAEEANRAKSRFIASMSHEIRTPINAVLGMDEMILRQSKNNLVKEYAQDIKSAGSSLLSIINDILDMSRIESGKMEIVKRKYSIAQLTGEIESLLKEKALGKGLIFTVKVLSSMPDMLYGDSDRIKQAAINLINNAIKYTKRGSIVFSVSGKEKDGKWILKISVKDTGDGIKKEDMPKLFEAFERIDEKKNRSIEGSGLGLNITSRILQLMGGEIHVKSKYGKGSAFWFTLPQKIISRETVGDYKEKSKNRHINDYAALFEAPDAQILVVDDNEMNRKVLKSLLKETKIKVYESSSGKGCLEKVSKKKFDAILLDHMMPEMDGIETFEHLKKLPGFNTPVIMLTANASTKARTEYADAGFDDIIIKPINPTQLEETVKRNLPKEKVKKGSKNTPREKKEEPHTYPDCINTEYAMLHFNDSSQLDEAIKVFAESMDSQEALLQKAYASIEKSNDTAAYRIQVHAMKSQAGTVGFISLQGIAKVLEEMAIRADIKGIHSLHHLFVNEWEKQGSLIKQKENEEASKEELLKDEEVVKLAQMIDKAILETDIDTLDKAAEQLKQKNCSTALKPLVKDLRNAVIMLNDTEIHEIVGKIQESASV